MEKIIQEGVTGKCFNFIFNLYKDIKSKVSTNEGSTECFDCNIGVRQGESMSPILFTFFLNDLEHFLNSKNVDGVKCDFVTDEIVIYFKLLVLMYADDTVLFSDNSYDLQKSLNFFQEYCTLWKLNVNISKTKIVIFGRGKLKQKLHFFLNDSEIDIVDEQKYLGIYLGRTGSSVAAKKHIADQANKAVFALLKKIRNLSLPFDVQIDLFDKMIKPILLYGCELWGVGNVDIIEKVQLKFFKQIFHLKNATPSYMIYGELGVTPLYVEIQKRIVSFWCKLIDNYENNKLSSLIYNLVYEMHMQKRIKSQWIESIKEIFVLKGLLEYGIVKVIAIQNGLSRQYTKNSKMFYTEMVFCIKYELQQ